MVQELNGSLNLEMMVLMLKELGFMKAKSEMTLIKTMLSRLYFCLLMIAMSYCHPHPPPHHHHYQQRYQHPQQHQQHSSTLVGSSPSYRIGWNLSNQHPRHATVPQQNSTASRFQFPDGFAIMDVPASRVRVLPTTTSTLQFQDGVAMMDVPASSDWVLPNTTSTLQFQDGVATMDDIFTRIHELLLLAPEEIVSVRTGLSEEEISTCMKTRVHHKSATSYGSRANLEKENDSCTICQTDFADEKLGKIGTLYCGHEYRVKCIKQWLLINKTCPICRRPALP